MSRGYEYDVELATHTLYKSFSSYELAVVVAEAISFCNGVAYVYDSHLNTLTRYADGREDERQNHLFRS